MTSWSGPPVYISKPDLTMCAHFDDGLIPSIIDVSGNIYDAGTICVS